MIYNLILFLHILIAVLLLGTILVQRGRSGGLIESLGGIESLFGTKTSSFFVKLTVILAILFFLTSVSLAYLSKEKAKSIMERYTRQDPSEKPSLNNTPQEIPEDNSPQTIPQDTPENKD